MRVFDPLTLLALPNDVAIRCDGWAERCYECHCKHVKNHAPMLGAHIDLKGVEVLDNAKMARDFGSRTRHPLQCWDCLRHLRTLADLNPV